MTPELAIFMIVFGIIALIILNYFNNREDK